MSKCTKLISIAIILIIALLLYKLFSSNQVNFIHRQIMHENFELIKNGSFKNANDISSLINKKGNNKIIKIDNPSDSDFALMQDSENSEKTYYEIETKVVSNMKYTFTCWYYQSNKWKGKDNIINIKIPTNQHNYLPPCNIKVVKEHTMKGDGKTWKLLSTSFKVPPNSTGKAQLYLGYKPDSNKGFRYISGVRLSINIPGVTNFPKSESLTSMVIGSSKCSYDSSKSNNNGNLDWTDITGLGNDFHWGSNPIFNNQGGYFSFTDTSDQLLGPSIGNLFPNNNTNNFTLVARYTSMGIQSNTQSKTYGTLFNISGSGLNNKTSLQLDIPNKRGNIILYVGGIALKSKDELNTMRDNVYILSIKNNYPNLYIYSMNHPNNENLNLEPVVLLPYGGTTPITKETKFQKMYFEYKKSFSINYSMKNESKLFGNLYSVIVFKDGLDSDAVRNIGKKLIKLKPNRFDCGDRPDMNEHFFDNGLNNNNLIEHYDNKKEDSALDDTSMCYNKNDKFKNDFDDSSGGTKKHDARKRNSKRNSKKCNNICYDQCSDYTENDIYNVCIKSCKEERKECGNTGPGGRSGHGGRGGRGGRGRHGRRRDDCPIVFKNNGKYIVYIPKNSREAREFGKHGRFNYGKKRHHAKKIYESNFPDCPLPEILDDNSHNPTVGSCPFIVKEHNPCYSRACRDTDWSKWKSGDITNCRMNDKCKGLVDNYCSMYNQIDPACECWDPTNKDDKKCAEFRNHFNIDDNCSISQFKITAHPDIGKYIKRDSIPCWNCDLEDSKNIKANRQYK